MTSAPKRNCWPGYLLATPDVWKYCPLPPEALASSDDSQWVLKLITGYFYAFCERQVDMQHKEKMDAG